MAILLSLTCIHLHTLDLTFTHKNGYTIESGMHLYTADWANIENIVCFYLCLLYQTNIEKFVITIESNIILSLYLSIRVY